jgi:hypothetical protein
MPIKNTRKGVKPNLRKKKIPGSGKGRLAKGYDVVTKSWIRKKHDMF